MSSPPVTFPTQIISYRHLVTCIRIGMYKWMYRYPRTCRYIHLYVASRSCRQIYVMSISYKCVGIFLCVFSHKSPHVALLNSASGNSSKSLDSILLIATYGFDGLMVGITDISFFLFFFF